MKTNIERKLIVTIICVVLALLAVTFVTFHDKKPTINKLPPPQTKCTDRAAEKPQSLKQLIDESSIIAVGTLVPEEDMPEVSIDPSFMSDVRVNVAKQLKGANYNIEKTVHLCPSTARLYYSTEPVILFLKGIDDKDRYWVPVDAFGTMMGASKQRFYDFQFKDAKSVYSQGEIEQAISYSDFMPESEYSSTKKENSYKAIDGNLTYPANWSVEFCTDRLIEIALPGKLSSKKSDLSINGYTSNLYCKDGKLMLKPAGSQFCKEETLQGAEIDLSNGLMLSVRGPSESEVSAVEIKEGHCRDSMITFSFASPIDLPYSPSIDRDQFMETPQYKDIVKFTESIKLNH